MSRAFFGGIPTAIDTRRLLEAFPELEEGDELTHDQVEEVLNMKRDRNRYRTVTNAWRKQLLNEKNIEIASVPGTGFRVLPPSERISTSLKGFRSGVRKQMRAVKRSSLVRTDDEILRRKQDLMQRYGAAIAGEAASMMKEIEPPKPPRQMPRLIPLKRA